MGVQWTRDFPTGWLTFAAEDGVYRPPKSSPASLQDHKRRTLFAPARSAGFCGETIIRSAGCNGALRLTTRRY